MALLLGGSTKPDAPPLALRRPPTPSRPALLPWAASGAPEVETSGKLPDGGMAESAERLVKLQLGVPPHDGVAEGVLLADLGATLYVRRTLRRRVVCASTVGATKYTTIAKGSSAHLASAFAHCHGPRTRWCADSHSAEDTWAHKGAHRSGYTGGRLPHLGARLPHLGAQLCIWETAETRACPHTWV